MQDKVKSVCKSEKRKSTQDRVKKLYSRPRKKSVRKTDKTKSTQDIEKKLYARQRKERFKTEKHLQIKK